MACYKTNYLESKTCFSRCEMSLYIVEIFTGDYESHEGPAGHLLPFILLITDSLEYSDKLSSYKGPLDRALASKNSVRRKAEISVYTAGFPAVLDVKFRHLKTLLIQSFIHWVPKHEQSS